MSICVFFLNEYNNSTNFLVLFTGGEISSYKTMAKALQVESGISNCYEHTFKEKQWTKQQLLGSVHAVLLAMLTIYDVCIQFIYQFV